MSIVKSTIAVCVMSLFAAVALFPINPGIENVKGGTKLTHTNNYVNDATTVIADGGSPQPPIPPPSGFEFAS
jgi:hypothetical protein